MNQRGANLIELCLMIALLPIVIGSWMGNTDFQQANLDRAARKIETDLRYCQQVATSEEVNCGIQVTNNTNYNLYKQAVGNIMTDPYTRGGMLVNLATFYQGVTLGANYQVEFNNLGKPVIGAGTQIILTYGNSTRTVTVTANTGYIQVQ